MLAANRPRPISVYRTTVRDTRDDALISPFLLDASSIALLSRHSRNRYLGTWLYMPVMVRLINTKEQALHHINYLSRLRHPNLEQFLGAVVNNHTDKAIITEFVNGKSITQLLNRSSITSRVALTVALDAARALVYLHATTGLPHGGVRPESVLYDPTRSRAIVLLSTSVRTSPPCAAPEIAHGRVGKEADVYSLAALLVNMFQNIHHVDKQHPALLVHLLPKALQDVVRRALLYDVDLRPSMRELCQVLADSYLTFGY